MVALPAGSSLCVVWLEGGLRVDSFTPAAGKFFPLAPSDIGRPFAETRAGLDYPALENDARDVLRSGQPSETQVQAPRSASRHLVRIVPCAVAGGGHTGLELSFTDITALAQAKERQGRILENIPQLVWTAKAGGQWTWAGPQWQAVTGQPLSDAIGHGWLACLHPEDCDGLLEAWAGADERHMLEARLRVRNLATGEYSAMHMRAASGTGAGAGEWFGTFTDIDELAHLQQHQRSLLGELQRRVRNTLAVIRSIARRSAETSESVEDYAGHLEGRITAIARVQNILTRGPDAEVDLQSLLLEELAGQGARERQYSITGEDISLSGKAAETLSLVVHELATNAVKFGSLSLESGHVAIGWQVKGSAEASLLRLTWRETGITPAPRLDRRGFGTELIEKIVPYELGGSGTMEQCSDGICCTLEIPMSSQVKRRPAQIPEKEMR